MGVSRSLDEFAAKVMAVGVKMTERQLDQMQRSGDFIQRNLIEASQQAAGKDRRLSRAGPPANPGTGDGLRKGYFLGFTRKEPRRGVIEFAKTGPWQFVDDSVTSGPTKPHDIGPRPDVNPRPLPPSKRTAPSGRYAPAIKFRGGGFSKSPVAHPGSARFPFWNRAIYKGRSKVIEMHRREFQQSIREVF